MSLQEVKQKTTSSEFALWMQFLLEEVNYFHREDYYFAQIACIIDNMFRDEKDRKEPKDYIIKFKIEDLDEIEVVDFYNPEVEDEEKRKQVALAQKATVLAWLGRDESGNKIKRPTGKDSSQNKKKV